MISKRLIIIVVLSMVMRVHAADEQQQRNLQLFCALQDDAPAEIIMARIEEGADPRAIEQYNGNENALHYAAQSIDIDPLLVRHFIEEHTIDINGKDCAGSTPCHIAAAHNRSDLIEILHQKGADVDVKNCAGNTPLHFACLNGALKVVTILLMYDVNKDEKNKEGKTPLDVARTHGHKEIADFIENWQEIPTIKEPENPEEN